MKRSSPSRRISEAIRERGPVTVAAFMDLALYDPRFGYYARAARRSGRAGDFFTSVDVGPVFGELLEIQLAEMHEWLGRPAAGTPMPALPEGSFDLVEAGAGNGRLSRDILCAARQRDPEFYDAVRLHLVEGSRPARGAQSATLGAAQDRLQTSGDTLPASFEGALLANELLDALPVHQVVMRQDGLREIYVTFDPRRSELTAVEGPLSTDALERYLQRAGVTLEPGWRVEINLRAIDWIGEAARRLHRGFMIIIDYGHRAGELYSAAHASGTLTTFHEHRSRGPEVDTESWLSRPGAQDITAHVDFTGIRAAAEAEGLQTLGFLDQTYFLLGLLSASREPQRAVRGLKTLLMPGGLGSAMKVLILGKNVGTPRLLGCSYKVRVT